MNFMMNIAQSETYAKWELGLKDRRARVLIAARVNRLAAGLAGDVESVGDGVSELRIHFGPGYRIYHKRIGNTLILLLCGGTKRTQQRDIQRAKQIAEEWSDENG